MRWVILAARFWLGLWMLLQGLDWWVRFWPQPTGVASHYLHIAFMQSGLFSVAKATEVLMGLALLTNRYVPLLCVVGFPVTFNVAWVQFVIEGAHLSGYFVLFTHLFLLIVYLRHYRCLLALKGAPLDSLEEIPGILARRNEPC
jgi:hypothetical protein